MIAPASMHAPPAESEPDKPAGDSSAEPGVKEAKQQAAREAAPE